MEGKIQELITELSQRDEKVNKLSEDVRVITEMKQTQPDGLSSNHLHTIDIIQNYASRKNDLQTRNQARVKLNASEKQNQ